MMPARIQLFFVIFSFVFGMIVSASLESTNTCGCSVTNCNCMRIKFNNFESDVLGKYCTDKIESILVAESNLTTLGANSFESSGCRQLISFIFRFNGIENLDKTTFNGLDRLKVLDLSYNKIESLEIEGLFASIGKSLRTLKLNANNIKNLTGKSFEGLNGLTALEMKDNPLVRIDVDTFKATPLLNNLSLSSSNRRLNLSDGLFQSLNQLTLLNISALTMEKISDSTFQGLKNLERLLLVNNLIGNMGKDTFSLMTHLIELNLTNNRLMCLEYSFFRKLTNLRHLDLSVNRLTYIDNKAFYGLENLVTLNLKHNPIAMVEKSAFCPLVSLFTLEIKIMGRLYYDVYDKYDATAFSYLNQSVQIIGIENNKPYYGLGKQCKSSNNKSPSNSSSSGEGRCNVATMEDLRFDYIANDNPESRRYLLIIVALCIAFLLIAFSVIMTYRAWSKRKMQSFHAEENNAVEKQEMLERPGALGNHSTEVAVVLQNGGETTALGDHPPGNKAANSDNLTENVNAVVTNPQPRQPNGSNKTKPGAVSGTGEARLSMNPPPGIVDDGTIVQLGMV